AGQIHNSLEEWQFIFNYNDSAEEIRDWVRCGVNIFQYVKPFKVMFLGESYDSDFPPRKLFNNSNKCRNFVEFISDTIKERLINGSVECLGRVGAVPPPYIVAPLVVEPSKPRLCINLMFLNNWIRDKPFSLDTLKDVPRSVGEGAFFTLVDDKSGFDNLRLEETSADLVGFQWAGFYFKCLTLPFGFKLSSYIYHTLNLQPTSYIRERFSVPIFVYIDDRLIEELRYASLLSNASRAAAANYIVCEILIRLGYCLNLQKSVFVPTQTPVFLGFVVDSVHRCFRLTEEKKRKFCTLRDACLCKAHLSVLELQRLAGRCISFMLVVPGAKMYTREMNYAISLGIKSGGKVLMSAELREELEAWKFLDEWQGKMVWKKERHLFMEIFSDASTFKWGGVVHFASGKREIYDYWSKEERVLPIMVLESKALLNVIRSIKGFLKGERVDAGVDNMVLINAWKNEGCRSRELNVVLKDLFAFVLQQDLVLNLVYVTSSQNVADAPSRVLNKSDASLMREVWGTVQGAYGGEEGHTVDLMSLDSNCMTDFRGKPLKHFTPFQTPYSAGVNVFSQEIAQSENCYAFPPFNLIGSLISFIVECGSECTVIVPASDITPIWQPNVVSRIKDALLIG
ncbi:MAG: reverse transcriptase domain-containing protein, partial [Candidatus Thiodiazotropha sp.]